MKDRNRYRFVIFANVILVRCCVGIIWASAGPLIPLLIQEFGISRSVAGWFASIAPLTIAAVSVPINSLVNRFGLKRMFSIAAFLLSLGIFSFFLNDYIAILFFRMCFAAGTAVIVPVATAITAEWFSARELPLLNGIGMSTVNIGNGIAFLATVPIANWLSWNAPIVIYAAFALVCGICWVILGKEKEQPANESTTAALNVLGKRPDLSFRQILTNRTAWLMTLSVTVSWALANSFNSWLPDYYYSVFNIPLGEASSILSIYTVTATIASVIGGLLSTKIGRRKPFMIVSGLFTGLAALFSILFNNPIAIYISVACFGLFFGIQIPALFTIPMELPGISVRSGVIVIAMMQVGGNLGNFISPLVIGAIVDSTGSYLPGFIAFVILSYGFLIAAMLLPETGPGRQSA
ncbi:MAG: MFS transporter [Dehalococcoidales bacterium]|nr:MFS transporter [Dehalococcoidales bacterium]